MNDSLETSWLSKTSAFVFLLVSLEEKTDHLHLNCEFITGVIMWVSWQHNKKPSRTQPQRSSRCVLHVRASAGFPSTNVAVIRVCSKYSTYIAFMSIYKTIVCEERETDRATGVTAVPVQAVIHLSLDRVSDRVGGTERSGRGWWGVDSHNPSLVIWLLEKCNPQYHKPICPGVCIQHLILWYIYNLMGDEAFLPLTTLRPDKQDQLSGIIWCSILDRATCKHLARAVKYHYFKRQGYVVT